MLSSRDSYSPSSIMQRNDLISSTPHLLPSSRADTTHGSESTAFFRDSLLQRNDPTSSIGHSSSSSTYGEPTHERESAAFSRVHLISSVVDNKAQKFHPLVLRLPVAVGVPIVMFMFGVGLEAAITISERENGFPVPNPNVLLFASPQFLLAFVPTVMVIPVVLLWRELDWYVRKYQPYIVLSRGNASAEETLLYISLGTSGTISNSLRLKHHIVFWSAFLTVALQPLAGSIFQIQFKRGPPEWSSVTSTKYIGLSPDITELNELNAFASSAGFVQAAAYNSLLDPPFIRGEWAIAEFEFLTSEFLNGTMVVNTTGIQTDVSCTQPKTVQVTQSPSPDFTISSTSSQDCNVNVIFNPTLAAQQYGVASCDSDPNLDIAFRQVMFWFFHRNDRDDTPEARTVFCAPIIKASNVEATASLNDGSLLDVIGLGDYTSSNNVTGGDFAGKAYNGLLFEPTDNSLIEARRLAITSGVVGAIFRAVSQKQGGLQAAFDKPNGFLDVSMNLYTQYLSVSAKALYFMKGDSDLPAMMDSLQPRLVINTLFGHILALYMLLIGFIGLLVQLKLRHLRKRLFLAAPPGTIAAIMALSSHSGFGELLMPYDSEETLSAKLSDLKFCLDQHTGALIADGQPP